MRIQNMFVTVFVLIFAIRVMAQAPASQPAGKIIEICFVLDTTGSMSGLIEGAKSTIWSIANQVIKIEPKPQVYIGLVGYRDRGDEYITKAFDLTDDIDLVWQNLKSFNAAGGGDEPESVNQAMDDAINKIHWSRDPDVTKIIFLVGDAPPHMDYPDDVKYPQTCKEAVLKNLIVNTIQCGNIASTAPIWQEIARLGEGAYISLPQDGNMMAVATPFDKELAELNGAMNQTVLPYGNRAQVASVEGKVALAGGGGGAGGRGSIDRAAYNARAGKAIQGHGDLIDDLRDEVIKLDEVKAEDLPENLRKMSPDERKQYLDKQSAERAELQKKITGLARQREEYIEKEQKRLAAESGGKDSFDTKVDEIIQQEASKKH